MMPAVQDFERRLGILHQVEPIIEQAVNTLQKVIDLKGSPMAPPKPAPPPKPAEPEEDESESPDLGSLAALLGQAQQPAAAAPAQEEETSAPGGEMDLSALLGGLGGGASAAAPEPAAPAFETPAFMTGGSGAADEDDSTQDAEKDLLSKLLGKM